MQMSSRSTPEVTGPMMLAILLTVSARSSSGGGSSAGSSSANAVSTSGKSDNGSVSADKSTAKKGDTVAITVTPDAGYELGKLTVTDSKGNGKYTFTMPDGKVTVPPTFTKVADEKPSTIGYVDVASSAWYNDAIQYVTDKGLMSGTGDNKFSPSSSTTRGMLMTVLARYAGQDTTNSIPWYQAGMDWPRRMAFPTAPTRPSTLPASSLSPCCIATLVLRPQTVHWTASRTQAPSAAICQRDAVGAVENGIVNGSNGKLNPKNNATRAEVAAILMRFCEMGK